MGGSSEVGVSEGGQPRKKSSNRESPNRASSEEVHADFNGVNQSSKGADIGQRDAARALPSNANVPDAKTMSMPQRSAGIVWSQAGATMIVPIGAPDPEAHRPRLSETEIHAILDRKRRLRDEAIERRIQSSKSSDKTNMHGSERFAAAIAHDMDLDLSTTNRQQLLEIGVELPPIGGAPNSPEEVHQLLWRMVYGLARLGIFLVDTDHLDDRALVTLLLDRILNDCVPDIPPNDDMTEFIGLCDPSTMGVSSAQPVSSDNKPDGLLGPFDCPIDDGDDEWQPWGVADTVLGAEDQATVLAPSGAARTDTGGKPHTGQGRDSMLPRPYREHLHRPRSDESPSSQATLSE